MLALLDADGEDQKVSLQCCGVCLLRRQLEPAGRGFHEVHELPKIEAKRKKKPAKDGAKDGSDDEQEAAADASWKKKRKEGGAKSSALKLSPQLQGEDLYALLEISESASAEQIKKQYRKMALQHHPDKQGDDAGEKPASGLSEKDMHFIKIQEAYEVLSDQSKRRQYDSQLDFDESIPDEVDESLGFFKTFGPVFNRNGRWSTRHPVPDIGDENTDINKVHKFYDFWLSFETWRDFSMHGEYNLEDADFREERRWMERQNQKIVKKYEQDERRRILKLAETAERLDPRIKAEREEKEAKKREEKERRARIKQEEEDAKRAVIEEKRRKEEEEKRKKEEEERQAKEKRKEAQQVAKGLRQRLKKWASANCKLSAEESEELQDLCLGLEAEVLEALCERLEAKKKTEADAALRHEMSEFKRKRNEEVEQEKRQKEEARKQEEQKQSAAKDAAAAAAAGSPWSTEELGVLAKGLQKFPGGQAGRWKLIAQMLSATGYIRTEQEVIAKTKELSDGQSLRSMGAVVSANNNGTFQGAAAKAKAKAKAAAEPAAAPASPMAASPKAAAAPDAAEWNAEQQKCLEEALKKYPASMDKNERWKSIAEDVPGKTKAQCVERFKFLREQLAKKK